MTTYLYPKNLKATANLWLWSLRDFAIICIALLLSVLMFAQTQFFSTTCCNSMLRFPYNPT